MSLSTHVKQMGTSYIVVIPYKIFFGQKLMQEYFKYYVRCKIDL